MIRILDSLRKQELLGNNRSPLTVLVVFLTVAPETFLPFDLDRIFSASFTLSMLDFITGTGTTGTRSAAHSESDLVIQHLIDRGCIPAQYRRSELDQLDSLIRAWHRRSDDATASEVGVQPRGYPSASCPIPGPREFGLESLVSHQQQNDLGSMDWLSPDQILSLAQMVERGSEDPSSFDVMDSWLWEALEDDGHPRISH